MVSRIAKAVLAAGAVVISTSAAAIPIVFQLVQIPENPVNASTATMSGTVSLDPVTHLIVYNVAYQGLSANVTVAHIHCCTTGSVQANPAVTNAAVASQTPSFPGFPTTTTGTFDATFDLSLASSWNAAATALLALNGNDTLAAEGALLQALTTQRAYFNIHTSNFPGGEIRATTVRIPEPGSLALLGAGLWGLFGLRRKATA